MPAAPIDARCHLLGSIQESETLQYRQGVSTRNITPISWHSPPKCLQVSPWPNSWITLVTASVRPSQIQFWAVKNWWNVGSFERKTSNSTVTSVSADSAKSAQIVIAGVEYIQRTLG